MTPFNKDILHNAVWGILWLWAGDNIWNIANSSTLCAKIIYKQHVHFNNTLWLKDIGTGEDLYKIWSSDCSDKAIQFSG